jgi:hypothetical protein
MAPGSCPPQRYVRERNLIRARIQTEISKIGGSKVPEKLLKSFLA